MPSTEASAKFTGAPESVLGAQVPEPVPQAEGTVSAPPETPDPSGTAPTPRAKTARPAAPAAPVKRGRGRPKGTTKPTAPKGSISDAVGQAAEAAATALEKEALAKRGRPTIAQNKNDVLEAGLVNFYVGLGGMCSVAGMFMRNDKLKDGGAAMIAQSRDCAAALVAAADQSPTLRKALEYVTMAGGASLIVAAHGPIVMAFMGAGVHPTSAPTEDAPGMETVEGLDIASLLSMLQQMPTG